MKKGSKLINSFQDAKSGIIKHGSVRELYSSPRAGGQRLALKELSKYSKDVMDIMKDLKSLSRRSMMKKLTLGTVWSVAAYQAARNLIQQVRGSTSVEQGGGQ